MTPHIVSWSDNEICISPVLSSAASIVSFDSSFSDIFSSHSQMSPTASKAPGLHIAGIGAKHTTFLEPSEGRKIPGGGHTTPDDSFIRHDAYFFKDGNVTFLVGGTLYCVHRYFFSRDSVYFSTRFAQLGIHDHKALPTIISIGDIECKDFEALLSVLYPTTFEAHELTYEQWKSVLHLSTRWGFASLRKLSLKSITPPTPHDQFVLARTYSVGHWVLPALTALCSRPWPLCLDEAQQMSMEDVVLVARVREEIRGGALRVDVADIQHHIEVVQAGKPTHPVSDDIHGNPPKKGATAQKSDSMAASAVDSNVEAEIAEMTGAALPSGSQHRGMKEGETSKEVPVALPGVELPDALERTPQDCLKKNVAMSAMPTGRTRKLKVASPKAAASPLAKVADNHAAGAMARQEAEVRQSAGTMHSLEAEAAKECPDAEDNARKLQEEAVRARERACVTEAKKAAVSAEVMAKCEAEFTAKVEAATNAYEEAKVKAVEAKAAAARAELGAKQIAEKEILVIEAKSNAEAAEADEKRKRVEAAKADADSLARRAEEQIARQRAADKAARAAAEGAMAPARGSGSTWFSRITQAASVPASAIPTEGPTPPTTSTSLWNSDPWSKRYVKNTPSQAPSTELGPLECPGNPGIPIQFTSTIGSTRGSASMTSITAVPSSASLVSSSPTATLVWQERKPIDDRPDGKWFVSNMSYFGRQISRQSLRCSPCPACSQRT
ncbi:hypothetical protein EDB87DRAFT_20195 [Lactarius vividus]|nr:hypothetical protein EDB87DRAFT_20195 [Lactarius vividus]